MIDVLVHLSRWPTRRLPREEPGPLAGWLAKNGVKEAWAGSFDALLHRDMAAVNARLADTCRSEGSGIFRPVGSINPALPDWEEDLRRCAEVHKMGIVRVYPNYHGYGVGDPRFGRLVELSAARQVVLQIVAQMEDPRAAHPFLRVDPVDPLPLLDLVPRVPGTRLVLSNALGVLDSAAARRLAALDQVYFDFATLEGLGGLARLFDQVPVERLLFGSHEPFFPITSALGKLDESALDDATRSAILLANPRRLMPES